MSLSWFSSCTWNIINRRGVGKVRHLSCRCLWLQARMADGSMIVSPISGLKNPADIGTKRLNDQRMRALMFLLGMFDSMNNCHVGEVEARAILQQQDLKQAMSSLRRLMKSDVDASGALQLMMFMNALSVARGMDWLCNSFQPCRLGLVVWLSSADHNISGLYDCWNCISGERPSKTTTACSDSCRECGGSSTCSSGRSNCLGRGRRRVHARNIVGQMVQV